MRAISLTLNGKEVTGRSGMSVLELAREHGIELPTLCHSEHLAPAGICGVCAVEDEKRRIAVPACKTLIEPGMAVSAESRRAVEARAVAVERIYAKHRESCVLCDTAVACEFKKIVSSLGVPPKRFGTLFPSNRSERANRFVLRDPEKCVGCARCARVCREVKVIGAIGAGYAPARGAGAQLAPWAALDASACRHCGTCIEICPVGALSERPITVKRNAAKSVATTCSFCACGCSLLLEVEDNEVIAVRPNPRNSINGISLCARGHYGNDYINSPERLKYPAIRENETFARASWDEALGHAIGRLREIKSLYGPDSLGVLGSIRCTNEENFLFQKLARAAIGTNNICNSARMVTFPSIMGLTRAFGYSGATGLIEHIEKSNLILLLGTNPYASHPLISDTIKRAVKFNGAGLLQVDPRDTQLTPFARMRLRPKPGTDIALLNGMMQVIVEENLFDKKFVNERTEGFDKLLDCIARYPPQYVEKLTGVAAHEVVEAARLFASAGRASIIYGSGITQYINAAYSVLAIANLALLTGNVGKAGAGVYPLMRNNNAQGACDMGALPDFLPGYRKLTDPEASAVFEKEWNVQLPRGEGLSGIEIIGKAISKEIRGIILVGANTVETFPDSNMMRRALSTLDFLVVIDIFPTATSSLAHVVLPAACFAEKDGTYTNCERRIQRIRKAVEAPGESRADWKIVADLISGMGVRAEYSSPSEIMDEISRTTPIYGGVSYARLERETLHWPCASPETPGTEILYENSFPAGKGKFTKVEYLVPDDEPDIRFPFYLISRSHLYHFGSGTRTKRSRLLSDISRPPSVEISREDARKLNIEDGDNIRLASKTGSVILKAKITDGMPSGMLFFPVSVSASKINSLFSAELDALTRTPNKKMCVVNIEKE